jgi:hypothetical protein
MLNFNTSLILQELYRSLNSYHLVGSEHGGSYLIIKTLKNNYFEKQCGCRYF